MTPLNRKLTRDLFHLRGQVIALTLVVACGIGTYVTMRASYQSLLEAQQEYYAHYRFADIFTHVKWAPESLVPAISAIQGVAAVETRIVMDVTLDVPGLDEPAAGLLVSIPPRRDPVLNRLFLRAGRWPETANEIVISENFANANQMEPGAQLSAIMNGKWARLNVVGKALSPEFVYEIRPGEIFPDNRRFGILWMKRDAVAAAFNMEGAFNDATFSLARQSNEADVVRRIDTLLDRYGSLGAYGRSNHTSARIVTDHIEEIRTSGLVLPAIFLGTVAFLLHVLMSRLVSTQRGQVAVLKAFGYRDWEIGLHYVQLALVAVIAGTLLGMGVGLWLASSLTALFSEYFRFPSLSLRPDPRVMLTATGISGAAACMGAIAAVRRAVSLAPAEAMRPEAPAHFQPGLLERTGLRPLLSPATRMIVRNLERRPIRAMLSALAIGFAVAILVVGWSRVDAVDELAALQFNHIQREDIMVGFHEPRPASVAFDLAHLPGVLRVEPFRQVPVRLRFGHRSRLTAVTGLSRDAELRRPLDAARKSVELPREGLLLNSQLAELLGIDVGKLATVEVLEGARPVREIVVARLVDEPVGLGAYLDLTSLQHLLRESPTVSGAYLRVDPASSASLYSLLKRMPAVSSVAVRETVLASFWKILGDSITSTTFVLIGFAVVIALGIVYNSARISLSERGNELASLRILGFTKVEIGRILLGEQALLTLAAIPLGFLIGYAISWYVAKTHSPDILRVPFVISGRTYAFAAAAVAAAALLSGSVVARRLQQMDLTAVLKSRE